MPTTILAICPRYPKSSNVIDVDHRLAVSETHGNCKNHSDPGGNLYKSPFLIVAAVCDPHVFLKPASPEAHEAPLSDFCGIS
jgi:hypothetical protein